MFLLSSHNVVGVLLFGAFFLYWRAVPFVDYLKRLNKTIFNARHRRWVLRPKPASEVPYLNQDRLEQMSKELQNMGFAFAGDYVGLPQIVGQSSGASTPAPLASPFGGRVQPVPRAPKTISFHRMFLSPSADCAATAFATLSVDQEKKRYELRWGFAFISFAPATDGGESWSYETSNWVFTDSQKGIASLFRRARALKTYHPNVSLDELWTLHQTRRQHIARAGGLSWKRATSHDVEDACNADFSRIEEVWKTMTPLKMARLLHRFKGEKNKNEWPGELKGKLCSP